MSDAYMKDDRAKSIARFIASLEVLAKYEANGMAEKFFNTPPSDMETERLADAIRGHLSTELTITVRYTMKYDGLVAIFTVTDGISEYHRMDSVYKIHHTRDKQAYARYIAQTFLHRLAELRYWREPAKGENS